MPGVIRAAESLGIPLVWMSAACVSTHYQLPMTAAELSHHGKGAALVAYLSQPTATASVCDPRAPGPHFGRVDDEVRTALSRGFNDGRIPPDLWRACVKAFLQTSDQATATGLLDDVLTTATSAVESRALEQDAAAQARLDAMEQLYVDRGPDVSAPANTVANTLTRLQRDIDGKRLGPVGQSRGSDLLVALDLERNRWNGRPVDASALDALQTIGNERVLRWAMNRLPDESLRREARRRVIRLHLGASPFPEVKQHAQAVEQAVMATGANPITLAEHPPVRGWLDPSVASARAVVVEQLLPEQTARLLSYTSGKPTPAVIPEIPTRGTLHVELRGISLPVTTCAPAADLDVTPCLPPEAIEAERALAEVDAQGALHVIDSMAEAAAVALARTGRHLVIPIAVAGQRLAELNWPLQFAAPADLVLSPSGEGAPGPDLDVHVDGLDSDRLIFDVEGGGRSHQAVLEWPDADPFHVVSRGGAGRDGRKGMDGMNGADGVDGQDASCPGSPASNGSAGGDGSNGWNGGPGGPGGRGGDLHVTMVVPAESAESMDVIMAVLEKMVRSEGGPGGRGGSGGAGGRGGRGGRGGSGTTCTDTDGHIDFLSSGIAGSDGSDGSRGFDGAPGSPGVSGHVTFVFGR